MYFVHKHIKIHRLLTNIISYINIPCIHICYCLLLFVITSLFHVFAGDIFVFADESCYRWRSMFSLAFYIFAGVPTFSLAFHLFAGVLSLALAYVYFAGTFSFRWCLAVEIFQHRWRYYCFAGDIFISLVFFPLH
jgi:hypothetical protein